MLLSITRSIIQGMDGEWEVRIERVGQFAKWNRSELHKKMARNFAHAIFFICTATIYLCPAKARCQ